MMGEKKCAINSRKTLWNEVPLGRLGDAAFQCTGLFNAWTLSLLLGEGCKLSRLNRLIPEIPSSSNSLGFLTPALSPQLPLPQSLPRPYPSSPPSIWSLLRQVAQPAAWPVWRCDPTHSVGWRSVGVGCDLRG